jgi:2-methylcitrate dehydratase PrpD
MSRRLAEFVSSARLEDFPPEAAGTARTAVLDCIGVALAGSREPSTEAIVDLIREDGGAGRSTVLGTEGTTSPSAAALANGLLAHVLEFDDCSLSVDGHPSAVLVPAILALGEPGGISGRQFLEAYVVGFEVMAGIGRSTARHLGHRGWHSTAVLGVFAAAAAAARIMALPAEGVEAAFGVACSMAAGSRENFGTTVKALHCGLAARSGLLAAALAGRGISATASAFEGTYGFLPLYAGKAPAADAGSRPGRPLDIVDSGIIIKAYPCCGNTHAAIDALGAIAEEHALPPDDIAEIAVGVSCLVPGSLPFDRPRDPQEARFSMPFCLAVRLLEGDVKPSHFSDPWVHSADVRTLMDRIRMQVHPELAAPELLDDEFAEVTVTLRGGARFTSRRRTSERTGSPANPLTWQQLVEKYSSCAGRVLDSRAVEESAAMIGELERVDDLRKLTAVLAARK